MMKRLLRLTVPAALALAASACSLSSLLGGGEPPPYLLTLTAQAPASGEFTRTAAAGEAVTVALPVISKELRTTRIPAQITPTAVQYLTGVEWSDTPDRLFKDLVEETIRRTTNRVVLDADQAALDPGLVISGELSRFGYDASEAAVVVRYDAALSTPGGARVETRRFEANVPSTGDATAAGPALNTAANQVAMQVAQWVAR
jgi:cholesterol transport system auxiliary component